MARPIDLSWQNYLSVQYDAVASAMDAALAASQGPALEVGRVAAGIYVFIIFYRFTTETITAKGMIGALVRLLIVMLFLKGGTYFTPFVRDMIWETAPNTLARAVHGGGNRMTVASQFDTVSLAIDNVTAQVRERNTSWSVSALTNSMAAWIANGGMQWWNGVQGAVYMSSIRLTAIAIVLARWLLIFELFERTRGFFQYWIGVVAGMVLFQLASSIYLQLALRTQMGLLRSIESNPSQSVDEMVSALMHIANAIFSDALTMIWLPSITAVGGGVAAHFGVAAAVRMMPSRAMGAARALGGR